MSKPPVCLPGLKDKLNIYCLLQRQPGDFALLPFFIAQGSISSNIVHFIVKNPGIVFYNSTRICFMEIIVAGNENHNRKGLQ